MARLIFILLATLALPALAADAGEGLHAFNPPPGDISVDFLRQIFGGVLDGMKTGAGLEGQQTVVGAMMGVFNLAVLFLAMVFVAYTTIKATVDSAHSGELLGKSMSSVWVPLRTVAGTTFLLPTTSGFSLIQMGVLWLALQGVGVADAMWQAGMERLAVTGTLGRLSVPDARPLAANILRAEVCMAAMNKQYVAEERKERIVSAKIILPNFSLANRQSLQPTGSVLADNLYSTAAQLANSLYATVDYRWQSTERLSSAAACGSLSWKEESQQGALTEDMTHASRAPIMRAHTRAVEAMIQELRPVAQQIVDWKRPVAGAVEAAATHYEDAVAVAAKAAVDASPDVAQESFIKHSETGGWVLAGTWFNQMARLNDSIQSAANMLPVSQPTRVEDLEIKEALVGYRDAMTFTDEYLKDRGAAPRQSYEVSVSDATSLRSGDDVWRLLSVPAMAGLDAITQRIAGANTSPVTQLRALGNDVITAGLKIKAAMFLIAGFAGSRASDWTVGNVFNVSEALKTISGTVEWASSALWALGAMLAYYLPAIPAFMWVMGVIRWLASVAEAVLAAPLLAAFQIHPGGDDVAGRSGPGLMLILAMVMQPALLLAGLMLSALMMYPAGALVNMMFLGMVSGVTGSDGFGIVGLVAMSALYVAMMVAAMHACFALISAVPDNVMRYVGSQAGAPTIGAPQVDKGASGLEGGTKGAGAGAAKEGWAPHRDKGHSSGTTGGPENNISNADHLPSPKD